MLALAANFHCILLFKYSPLCLKNKLVRPEQQTESLQTNVWHHCGYFDLLSTVHNYVIRRIVDMCVHL